MPKKNKEAEDLGLWYTAIDEKPQDYDFREEVFSEDWEIPFELSEEEMDNEEFFPMMNYRYPLPNFHDKLEDMSDEDIKNALNDAGAVTLVRDNNNEEYYLALSGGGMDSSWDIVQAYINLGYYPPAHFCNNLPRMAGMKLTPEKERSIQACKNSLMGMKQRAESGLDNLDGVQDFMVREKKQRR